MSAAYKKKVAFIEIPDEALELVSHYSKLPDWEPALIVASSAESYSSRLARLLMVPFQTVVDPEQVRECSLVVVGSGSPNVLRQVSEAVQGTSIRIAFLDELLDELGLELSPDAFVVEDDREDPANAPSFLDDDDPVSSLFAPSPGISQILASLADSKPSPSPDPDRTAPEPAPEPPAQGHRSEQIGEEDLGAAQSSETEVTEPRPEEPEAPVGEMAVPPEQIDPPEEMARVEGTAVPEEMAPVEKPAPMDEVSPPPEPAPPPETPDTGSSIPEARGRPESPLLTVPDALRMHRETLSRGEEPGGGEAPDPDPRETEAPPASPPAPIRLVRSPDPGTDEPGGTPDPTFAGETGGDAVGFSLGPFLGLEPGQGGEFPIDPQNPVLVEFLETVLRETGADTGSIMLPAARGTHLRIAAAAGLSPEIVAESRLGIGEGLAGEAFAQGKPRVLQSEMPTFAEFRERKKFRIGASVPIEGDGRTAGVLSVNIESGGRIPESALLQPLIEFAREAFPVLLRAIDLLSVPVDARREVVMSQIDRLMARPEEFPDRLRAVTDLLQSAMSADFAHFYLLDPSKRQLEPVSGKRTPDTAGPQPGDRGFLAWLIQDGRPQIQTVADVDPDSLWANAFLPLRIENAKGLIVLEHFRLGSEEEDSAKRLLTEAVHQIEEMFEIEKGVESQDILSELTLKIAEQASQMESLPPNLRIQPTLEFALRLLAADVAVWSPGADAPPVVAQPQTRQAVSVLAEVWDHLEGLSRRARTDGSVAGLSPEGAGGRSGSEGVVPYAGSQSRDGGGVLLVFFAHGEGRPSRKQIPAQVLTAALQRIADLIGNELSTTPKAPEDSAEFGVTTHAVSPEELSRHLHREWERSRQEYRSFTLARFTFLSDPDTAKRNGVLLRNYLLAEKRAKDVLAEIREGVFIVLSGEPLRDAEEIGRRLRQGWEAQAPEYPLGIEITSFPRDGEDEEHYQSWICEDDPWRMAA